MPKLSILIPIYNVEQYLVECLDSVINQTLKDIEIICLNDGSTDNSLSIIKDYAKKDTRIKIIDKQNSGYGHTMNIGLDNATGEYIGIVEPDDYIQLDMYEVLYNKATENNVDLIKADFYRFTGNGDNLELAINKLDGSNRYYNKVIDISEDLTPFFFIMNTWSGIYKHEFIEKYHIRHNETPGASFQDNGFWFQTFMYAKRVYFLDKPLYMNRRDNPNSSVKSKEKVYSLKHEYDFIRTFIDADPAKFNRLLPIYWYKKFKNYYSNYYRIDDSFKDEFLKVFSSEFKRGLNSGEVDINKFNRKEKRTLLKIINNPKKFRHEILHNLSFLEEIFSIKKERGTKYLTILGKSFKI